MYMYNLFQKFSSPVAKNDIPVQMGFFSFNDL